MLETLWIMRHGLAESEFDTDFNRALSAVGAAEAESVAQQMVNAEDILPQHMLVSPFRRTQETAKIVHGKLGLEAEFETEDMLVHFADHKLLADYLLTRSEKRLMVVSHMPIVARLCQYLDPSCQIYGFHTAQTVRLDFDSQQKARLMSSILAKR